MELDRGALARGHEQDRWIRKRVNDRIEELFGVRYGDEAGVWRFLRRIGYSRLRPARRAKTMGRNPSAAGRRRSIGSFQATRAGALIGDSSVISASAP